MVAGAVIVRQRPPTAKGFFFLTLEDETGIANSIVPPALFERQRAVLVGAALLLLHGVVQQQDGVTSLKVVYAEPCVANDGATVLPASHDFR
jgi:error-prone DNA polymerase